MFDAPGPPGRPLLPKSRFTGLEGVAHLCTGGEAPWLRSHDDACRRFGELKSGGMAGREAIFRVYERAKGRVAARLGITADRVAFLAHASEGLNQAVAAVDWRPGDNAVVADAEFPSLRAPVGRLRAAGVEGRVVRARDHYVPVDDLAAAVDGRTRLLLVSQVSYLTGQRLDLARCAEIARAAGAWLAVDATHAFGVAPVDATLCDFVVSACYKWVLGTHGAGVFASDPARVGPLAPAVLGWHSLVDRHAPPAGAGELGPADPLAAELRGDAARLEAGNPGLLSLFVLDNALETLEPFETEAVLGHALALGGALAEGLRARGYRVITPADPAERAGNVCFLAGDGDGDGAGIAARLAARGVLVWGGEGRVRVSAHLYNDAADVDRFFDALDSLPPFVGGGRRPNA